MKLAIRTYSLIRMGWGRLEILLSSRLLLDKARERAVTDQTWPIIEWHEDSHPWVCVVMLSDARHMSGGETELMKGDGTTIKVKAPQMVSFLCKTPTSYTVQES